MIILNDKEKLRKLFKVCFKHEGKPLIPYNYQLKIAEPIILRKSNRIIVSATTRAGKTFIIALSAIIYAEKYANKRVVLIAPTLKQAKIMMGYIAEHLTDSVFIRNGLDENNERSIEGLKKELSRERITFKNGSSIKIISAEGTGARIMGEGGDLIIIDQTELINDDVYKSKILRMLGDNPDSVLVEITNPTDKNHTFKSWTNSKYLKIHIPYTECVKEGRLSQEYIEEMKESLTPIQFTTLYKAEFPEETEDALFRWKWVEDAINRDLKNKIKNPVKINGLDVAELGVDFTVLTKGVLDDEYYDIKEIKHWSKKDTMQTVGKVIPEINKKEEIRVDATGVGKGVYDRLKEIGYNAAEVKVGRSPIDEKQSYMFLNQKSEHYWRLRKLFEEGKISIPDHDTLKDELLSMKYEVTSAGKIKIIDPGRKNAEGKSIGKAKSPDFADSLMLTTARLNNKICFGFA